MNNVQEEVITSPKSAEKIKWRYTERGFEQLNICVEIKEIFDARIGKTRRARVVTERKMVAEWLE